MKKLISKCLAVALAASFAASAFAGQAVSANYQFKLEPIAKTLKLMQAKKSFGYAYATDIVIINYTETTQYPSVNGVPAPAIKRLTSEHITEPYRDEPTEISIQELLPEGYVYSLTPRIVPNHATISIYNTITYVTPY